MIRKTENFGAQINRDMLFTQNLLKKRCISTLDMDFFDRKVNILTFGNISGATILMCKIT